MKFYAPPLLVDLTFSEDGEEEMSTDDYGSGPVIVNVRSEASEWCNKMQSPSSATATTGHPIDNYATVTSVTSTSNNEINPGIDNTAAAAAADDPYLFKDEDYEEDIVENRGDDENLLPPVLVRDADEPIPTIAMLQMPTIFPMTIGQIMFGPHPAAKKKERRPRSAQGLSREQTAILTTAYENCSTLVPLTTLELMNTTGLPTTKIQTWFRNKKKRLSLTADFHNSQYSHNNNKNQQSSTTTRENISRQREESSSVPNRPNGSSSHQNGSRETGHQQQQVVNKKPSKPEAELTPEQILKIIEERREQIRAFPPLKVKQVLERCHSRCTELLHLFVEEQRGMKKKLVNETIRIKEKSPYRSIFTERQNSCIAEWRSIFMQQKTAGKPTKTVEKLTSADFNILNIWIPLMVYAYLLHLTLDETVRDFTYHSRNRSFETSDYFFPRYLNYIPSTKQ